MKRRSQVSKYKRITRSMKTSGSQVSKHTRRITRAGSQASKHKFRKWNRKNRHRRRSLNDFPDAILGHIISFLPTDSAFRTSVLSKRWRYVWTSLSSFKFREKIVDADGPNDEEHYNYMNFVERVVCYASRISKFSLSCIVKKDDVSRINKWISAAVSHNLQKFNITLYRITDVNENVLTHCLFSCQTLQVLKMCGNFTLLIPPQINLPNLKKLKLSDVTFKDYRDLNLLFESSPLEELVIWLCKWKMGAPEQLIISAPKLQRLTIYESIFSDAFFASSVITSPQLTTFYYCGGNIKDIQFSYSSPIVRASLHFFTEHPWIQDRHLDHLLKLLRSLRFTKFLDLAAYAVKGLSHMTVPTFENLTTLILSKGATHRARVSCKELEMFLNKCPRLENLNLPMGIFEEDYDINRLLSPMFECLSSLKNIKIGCFGGEDIKELFAVQILLVKATSLETMEITWNPEDVSKRKKIKTFLSAVPRGSKSCELNFKTRCWT